MPNHETSDETRRPSFAGKAGNASVNEALANAVDVERRSGQRHMSILRVGRISMASGEAFCLIRNISAGGLMAQIYRPIARGERVTVEMRGERKLAGEVRWTKDDGVGIQFDEPIDVAAVLADRDMVMKNGHRPRPPRLPHRCRATLRVGAGYHRAHVVDISQGGVRVALEKPIAVHADVVITMEGFRAVSGVVRWFKGSYAGIGFNQILAYPELTGWLRDHPGE